MVEIAYPGRIMEEESVSLRSVDAFACLLGLRRAFETDFWALVTDTDFRRKLSTSLNKYPDRLGDLRKAAWLLLNQDNQGDKAVWSNKFPCPPTFEKVLAYYVLGEKAVADEADTQYVSHSERLKGLRDRVENAWAEKVGAVVEGMSDPEAGVVRKHLRDWVLADAVVTTLLLNGGNWMAIPEEDRKQFESLDLKEGGYNQWSFGQDGVRTYREVENRGFARALAGVWYRGNESRTESVAALLAAASNAYQLLTDLLHKKNPEELTYKIWWQEMDVGLVEFAWIELKHLLRRKDLSGLDRGIYRLAVPAILALCSFSRKAEWENS